MPKLIIDNDERIYTQRNCDKSYIDGLKRAQELIENSKLERCPTIDILYTSLLIENEISRIKIEDMEEKIEILQAKIVRYEKG